MKKIISSIVIYLFTFNAIALQSNPNIRNGELTDMLMKYEFLLSAHPNAHLESFQTEQREAFREELTEKSKNMSLSEVKSELLTLVEEIPSQEKRDEFNHLINDSSKEELLNFLSNRSILNDVFKGQGANFTSSDNFGTINVILAIAAVVLMVALISNIEESKFEHFYSYSIDGGAFSYCGERYLSETDKILMKENAKLKCELEATLPETCRFRGFNTSDTRNSIGYEDGDYYECSTYAEFIADKPQSNE